MTSLYQDIKAKLTRLHVLEQFIVINSFVFIVVGIMSFLITNGRFHVFEFLSLSNDLWESILHPWSLLTYGFLHHSFSHLFFNMLCLYLLAQTFSNLFNARMSLKIYLLGIISGGILFLIASSFLPFLRINNSLVGASAGLWACIIFLSAYMPNKVVGILRFNFKLKYLAYVMIAYNLLVVFSSNSGGGIAHYGGGLFGFYYAKELQKGREIGRFLDSILNYFNKSVKTVYRKKHNNSSTNFKKNDRSVYNHQKQIDLILDKISKSGYESLTKDEKDFLFRAGKK